MLAVQFRTPSAQLRNCCHRNNMRTPAPDAPRADQAAVAKRALRECGLCRGDPMRRRAYAASSFPVANSVRAQERRLATPSALPISVDLVGRPRYCITEVREITLRSLIFDRFVSTSSWMPSAKYAFSFSSLRFSKGKTAIDLSILRAEEIRGRRKN